MRARVRLSDIGSKLGVSTVTVSKALADKDGVGDDLREKIKQTAREMGYRIKSSRNASGTGRTGNIGVLIPNRFYSMKNSFYWVLYNNVARELMLFDHFCLMELLSAEDEDNKTLPRMVSEKKVDGVIILGQLKPEYLSFFAAEYNPFILLDFYQEGCSYDAVVSDNYHSMYMMSDYLIRQGHKKIVFVGTFKSTSSVQDRYMGFVKAMLNNDLQVCHDEIINDRGPDGIYIELKLPSRLPDAFVCNCDEVAFLLIQKLSSMGYSVPDDVSVVGFDNCLHTGVSDPAITTIEVDVEGMAHAAAELIHKKIAGNRYSPGRTDISGRLIVKKSVKPR